MELSQENQLKYFSFIKEETIINPIVFLDVGALDCANSIFALNYFESIKPENIYAIEANPDSFEKILKKDIGKVNLYNIALSNSPGFTTIKSYNSLRKDIRGCSSILQRIDDWGDRLSSLDCLHHKVKSMRATEFLNSFIKQRPSLAIIDVEGYSFEVLKGFFNNSNDHYINVCLPESFMIEVESDDSIFGLNTYSLVTDFMEKYVPWYKRVFELPAYKSQVDLIYVLNSAIIDNKHDELFIYE